MALPTTLYDTATVLNPSSALTDFTLMVDLSRMTAAWWAAAENTQATRGRAAKDDGTELACDWIDYDHAGQTGWLRVKWSGTLATSGTQVLRIYPPVTGNSPVASGNALGRYAAYSSSWIWYTPGHDGINRINAAQESTANVELSYTTAEGKTSGSIYSGAITSPSNSLNSYNFGTEPITDFPVSILGWFKSSDATARSGIQYPWGFSNSDAESGDYTSVGTRSGEGGSFRWRSENEGVLVYADGPSGSFNTGEWNHLATVATSSEVKGYDLVRETSYATAHSNPYATTDPPDQINFPPKYITVYGWIGEVQLHDVELSAEWLAHEHAQTNDQAAFWGTWANVAVPTSVTTKISASSRMLISGLLFNRRNRRIL